MECERFDHFVQIYLAGAVLSDGLLIRDFRLVIERLRTLFNVRSCHLQATLSKLLTNCLLTPT